MFHRMTIPQQADALHVEPGEPDRQRKEKKHQIKKVNNAIYGASRESRLNNSFTKIKSSMVPPPYPVNNLYSQPRYCLHTHEHNNTDTDWRTHTHTHTKQSPLKKNTIHHFSY